MHPVDYVERVYAGVLGKLIGVYLGRPVENWSYERIRAEIGDIRQYIHAQRGRRLIVTDDDISGTFTFIRALEDFGFTPDFDSWHIGETWLNYLVERRTTLWWGGLGNSTEHTAYLRLKQGVPAPRSGSSELNGQAVSEQIGGQIFIDGWGLVCPNDPERATRYAAMASGVSHDGESIYGAQVIAALVSMAFSPDPIHQLVSRAKACVPPTSEVSRVITALQAWHDEGLNWRQARRRLDEQFGYAHYPGACPLIPNHGAVILALLWSEGDFDEGLHIVNTIGWDTDCNSGNVGCILGVLNGLDGIQRQTDWRGPVADRLFMPSADAGSCYTDAATEAQRVASIGYALAGRKPPPARCEAQFTFDLPGSVQGFEADRHNTWVSNASPGLWLEFVGRGEAGVWTFLPPSHLDFVSGYQLLGSPTLHSGQDVCATLRSVGDHGSLEATLWIAVYDANDHLRRVDLASARLPNHETRALTARVPDTHGYPIARIGLSVTGPEDVASQIVLECLGWSGSPTVRLQPVAGRTWGRAWVPCLERFQFERDGYTHLVHDQGIGLLLQGTRQWRDLTLRAALTPHLADRVGLVARCQGMRRWIALTLSPDGKARLIRNRYGETVLAETDWPWELYRTYGCALTVRGDHIVGSIGGQDVLEAKDDSFAGGAVGFLVESGAMGVDDDVRVEPA